jgi:hypothetical protein
LTISGVSASNFQTAPRLTLKSLTTIERKAETL